MTPTLFRYRDKSILLRGKLKIFSKEVFGFNTLNWYINAGNIIKVKIKEIVTPTLIIHPKFMTGNKPDRINELNPAIVVITVKKQGFIICLTVSSKSLS